MWYYDAKKNVLNISRIPYREVEVNYQPAEMYESYIKYVKETVVSDIMEYLVPLINEAIGEDSDLFKLRNVKVESYRKVYFHGRAYWEISMKFDFGTGIYSKNMKPFVVLRIPDMDEMGVMRKDGRAVAILAELTQDNEVTFEQKKNNSAEMKLMTEESYFCLQKDNTSSPKFVLGKVKMSLEDAIIALAVHEGTDAVSILSKLRSKQANQLLEDDEVLQGKINYAVHRRDWEDFVTSLMSDKLSLNTTRDYMNRVLTFDRAVGKILSKDIIADEKIIAKKGSIITESIIKRARKAKVDVLYVEHIPNRVGQYFARPVLLNGIKKGTQLIEIFKKLLPDVEGMYADKDYVFERTLIIKEEEEVTAGLLEALCYNGYTCVELKESPTTKSSYTAYFEKEILNNRQYLGLELGNPDDHNWYYKKDDGTFELDTGCITPYDIAALSSIFSELVEGRDLEFISNRDLGLRKKVKMANELFHDKFKKSVPKSYRIFRTKLRNMYKDNPASMCDSERMEELFSIVSRDWWHELMDSRLIQSIDTTNPVALHSSLNKIVSIVKDSNAISDSMRTMSMGHYGRFCPYEVPQSKKLGVVNAKASGCRIVDGIMKTAYHRVVSVNDELYISNDVEWLSVEEEEEERIADINSLDTVVVNGRRKITSKERVLARVPSSGLEKMAVEYIAPNYITMVNSDPNQPLGLVAQTVPFVGADDSTRVSFETSMAKQAKLIVDGDVPLVITSAFVDVPRENTFYQINAEADGEILEVDNEAIIVKYDNKAEPVSYRFRSVDFTMESVTIRHVIVSPGDRVTKGDLLMESNATKDGYMAIGKNLIVVFIPKGYNYEDGVHAAERAQYALTSYGAHIVEVPYPRRVTGISAVDLDYNKYMRPHSNSGIVLKLKSQSRDRQQRFNHKNLKGFLIKAGSESKMAFDSESAVFKVQSVTFDYLNWGDKMANRHGNKGVSPKLRDNTEMLMFPNGEITDVSYNPTGVTSRMNIGQNLEANLGFAAYILGIRVRSDSFNGATDKDIRRLLSYAYALANMSEQETESVYARFADLPEELHKYTRGRLKFIQNWAGCFNEDGTAYMFDPSLNKYIGPVLVGVNYIYKLIHESDKKLHVRAGYLSSDSNYSKMADAPTKGAAHAGGQRVGTMEADGLSAYAATAYLHEMANERGDNGVARSNFTVGKVHEGDAYRVDEDYAVRRSTQYFLQVLSSTGLDVEFDDDTPIPGLSKEENEGRRVCKARSIIQAENTDNLEVPEDTFDADYDSIFG